jgi:hypothetical protein
MALVLVDGFFLMRVHNLLALEKKFSTAAVGIPHVTEDALARSCLSFTNSVLESRMRLARQFSYSFFRHLASPIGASESVPRETRASCVPRLGVQPVQGHLRLPATIL